MSDTCQPDLGLAILISGEAGSGKTTLGRCVARALKIPMVDLDSVTNPLLDSLPEPVFGGHWLQSVHSAAIRDGRYAALREVARDVVASVESVVVVAPFTREIQGGEPWETLCAALEPARVVVFRIVGEPELFASRRADRNTARDAFRMETPDVVPAIPFFAVDGALELDSKASMVINRIAQLDVSVPLESSS